MTLTMSQKNQCAATSPAIDEHEKRKLRNRLSQRAFRRRQAEYIKELRDRAEAARRPGSERIVALEQENSLLRAQLNSVQSRLERLQVTLQAITGSISKTRHESLSPAIEESRETEANLTQSGEPTMITLQAQPASDTPSPRSPPDSHLDQNGHFLADDTLSSTLTTNTACGYPTASSIGFIDEPLINPELDMQWMRSPLQTQQIPDIWSFEYQTGTQSYINGMTSGQGSTFMSGLEWMHSNSPFSDHIQVLRQLLRAKLKQPKLTNDEPCRSVYQSVSAALAMFNSITRPDVMNWYAKTRFFHIIELTTWQMFPCNSTYLRVHKCYRPTRLQTRLQSQYPCVIDWVPFSSVRDGLIQLHAANPCIDQIFCDAVSAYVVEGCLSELVVGTQPTKVYIRVTDLIASISLDDESQKTDHNPTLPAPDVSTLFSSPKHACLVFKYLKMDCGASYYKMDPLFFSKYPELCGSGDGIIASGIALRPETQTTLTHPNYLDASTVATYRSFINFSLDAVAEICKMS